ncbi:AAEL011644-PA [Aedes aegypti]|uniref:AAEL011644-PA n=1 Tax=Aedes aegypti TaxID=7159 RepID=Q16PH0_AEDAE|nr:AAEL011644-PA [Aedes aegypti]
MSRERIVAVYQCEAENRAANDRPVKQSSIHPPRTISRLSGCDELHDGRSSADDAPTTGRPNVSSRIPLSTSGVLSSPFVINSSYLSVYFS